jgi:hypothetical protein
MSAAGYRSASTHPPVQAPHNLGPTPCLPCPGQFGLGWAWLVPDGSSLAVISTPNQDTPISNGTTLLLGVDV